MKISHRPGGWTRDGKDYFSDTCTVREMTWAELTEFLSVPVHIPNKKNAPMWLAGDSTGGCKNEHVRGFSAAVFDIDGAEHKGLTQDEFDRLIKNIEISRTKALVHGSYHFHADDENPKNNCIKIRVVVQLSRDISVKEWSKLRDIIMKGFEFEADEQTKNPGRWYFVPNIPEGAEYYFEVFEGEPYDVDVALALNTKKLLERAPKIEPEISTDMSDLWKQVRNMDMPLAATLEKGLPLGEHGNMHNTIHKTAARLVFKFGPTVPESAVFQVMRNSLENTGDAQVAKEHALQSIKDARRNLELKLAEDAEERRKQQEIVRNEQAKNAIIDVELGEDGKYSEVQVASWSAEHGCTVDEFKKRWIVHKGDAYFIFVDGKYMSPIGPKELITSFPRDFARAPIELDVPVKHGMKAVPVAEVLREHGTPAREMSASLALQKSYYDAKSQTFHEAVRPLRVLNPERNELVDEFLQGFGALVYNWFSVVTELDKQCALLFIHGPKDIGKTLMALGAARLWNTSGFTSMESYVQDFNGCITNNPFIFADETLPDIKHKSTFMRQRVGSPVLPLRRKFLPDTNIHGCPRFLVCSNNEKIFDTDEELTTEDLDAFIERIAFISIGATDSIPYRFIRRLQNDNFDFMGRWVNNDAFPRHLLWMRENHTFTHGRRYLVEGTPSDFHQRLILNTGFVSPVCEWIIRFIQTPNLMPNVSDQEFAMRGEGVVLLNVDALADAKRWDTFCKNVRPPSAARVAQALSAISKGTVTFSEKAYCKISPSLIYAASRKLKLSSVTALSNRINEPNQKIKEILEKGVHEE